MAGFRRVGSRLVAENVGGYTRDMGRAARATEAMEPAGRRGARGLDDMEGAMTRATIKGGIFLDVMRSVFRFIMGSAQQAIQVVAVFERLGMSIESFVARELRMADSTLTLTDALEQAKPMAQELLKWMQKLAIESPFDVQGVAAAFKNAQVYGFMIQEAQRLVAVTTDFAAATGAESHQIGMVTYALGQMRAAGKVLMQDLRQLMTAGVDVNSILQKMGLSLADVGQEAISSDEFIEQFLQTMEEDFGGAAKRQSETVSGLLNSLGDLKEIALRDFFTPMFQAALPYLAAAVEKFQQLLPLVQYFGELLGQATKFMFEHKETILTLIGALVGGAAAFFLITNAGAIMSAVMAIIPTLIGAVSAALFFLLNPINLIGLAVAGLAALFIFSFTDIRKKTDGFFDDMGGSLFDWGRDIILALAEGMASAINYVLDVLINLGNQIAYWLSPGSPPKLLPELDKWGAGAMMSYMEGWKQADFGMFKELGGVISGYLKSLPETIMPEKAFVPMMMNVRKLLAGAITEFKENGEVGEGTFKRITQALGKAGPALEGYIRALVKLKGLQQKYQEQLKPMYDELSEIEKRREEVRNAQRTEELQKILDDPYAPELAKELALMELREMELKKNIAATEEQAETELSAAEEELAAQQALIDVQSENNDLIKQQIRLLDRLAKAAESAAKAAGGAGKGGLPPGGGAGGAAGAMTTVGEALSGAVQKWKDKIDDLIHGEDGILSKFDGIGTKLEELSDTWSDVFIGITEAPFWTTLTEKLDGVGLGLDDFALGLAGGGISAWALAGVVGGPLGVALGILIGLLIMVYRKFGSWEDAFAEAKRNLLMIGGIITGFVLIAYRNLVSLGGQVKEILSLIWQRISQWAKDTWEDIVEWAENIWKSITEWFQKVYDDLVGNSILTDMWDDIIQLFTDKALEILQNIGQWVLDIIAEVQTLYDQAVAKVEELWTSITTAFELGVAAALQWIYDLIWGEDGILAKFNEVDWLQVGKDIIDGIVSGIIQAGGNIRSALMGLAQSAWQAIVDFFDSKSPSRKGIKLGESVGVGVALGLGRSSRSATKAAQAFTGKIASGMAMPVTNMAPQQTTNIYQSGQFTGIENANVASEVDYVQVQSLIRQTVQEMFPT